MVRAVSDQVAALNRARGIAARAPKHAACMLSRDNDAPPDTITTGTSAR